MSDPTFALRAARRVVVADRPRTFACIGDSITANGNSNGGAGPKSYLAWACWLSDGEMVWIGNYGTGGAKTAEIRTTNLPQVLALSPRPGYCVVLCGANDTGVTAFASFKADYVAIVQALLAVGIIPILGSLPANQASNKQADMANWRSWIANEAQTLGIPYVDFYAATVEPTGSGDYVSGYSPDGIHPSDVGAKAMGTALKNVAVPYVQGRGFWTPPLAVAASDPTNLMPNAFATASANGLATSLQHTGNAAVPSIVAATDGKTLGSWQRVTRNVGAATTVTLVRLNKSGTAYVPVTAGDVVEIGMRFQCSVESGTVGTTGQVGLSDQSSTTTSAGGWFINGWTKDLGPTTFYRRQVIPAGMTGVRPQMVFSIGEGWMQWAQVTLRNLTVLGMAS